MQTPTPTRVVRYAGAAVRWVMAGRPTREPQEVSRIFTAVCTPCEHFDAAAFACTECQCNVKPAGSVLLNKIAMATENCPQGKW